MNELAASAMIAESRNSLLAVLFVKSSALNYAAAVSLAEQAKECKTGTVGKSVVHFALFGKSESEARKALFLIDLVGKWTGTQIYGGGRQLQNKYHAKTFLQCYLDAMACSDTSAHCCYVRDNVLLPCRQLRNWFSYDPRHPATGAAQFEAAAIRRGLNWCPLLNVANIKEV